MDPELLGQDITYTFADLLADAEALANKAGGPTYVKGRNVKARDSFAYSETGEDSTLELAFEANRYDGGPGTSASYVAYHVEQDHIERVETIPEPIHRKAAEENAYEGGEEADYYRVLSICCRFSTDPLFDFEFDVTTHYHVNNVALIMHEDGVDVIEYVDHDEDDEEEGDEEQKPDEFDKLVAKELKDMSDSSDYLQVRDMLTTLMTEKLAPWVSTRHFLSPKSSSRGMISTI